MGGAFRGWWSTDALITNCTFVRNRAQDGGGVAFTSHSNSTVENCTFYANEADLGSGMLCAGAPTTCRRTVFSFGVGGQAIGVIAETPPDLECCDIYGNEGGDWTSEIEDQYGVNGNFYADPLFCAPIGDAGPMISSATSPYSVHLDSPCLPGNHPGGYDCGLIGAHGQGCGISGSEIAGQPMPRIEIPQVEPSTWGRIKAAYR
jgi:hypothetical protein